MKVGGFLARISLALVALAVLSVATIAQEGGDRLFELKEFSGLNLYSEKTKLAPGQALLALNVQFSKPGTISVLEGLTQLNEVMPDNKPLRGLGSITDFVNDSDRIITACSTFFFNTHGNSLSSWVRGSASVDTAARWWTTAASNVWQDSIGRGRAAEMWRAGWKVSANLSPAPGFEQLTIDYISDNNTFYTTTVPDSIGNHLSLDNQIWPVVHSESLPVRFVNVDVRGTPMVVALQAGMEPLLYDGNSLSTMRYLNVADSGIVQRAVRPDSNSGRMYISDPSKIGIWGDTGSTSIGPSGAGYWIAFPYNYGETDSSHWGRVFPVDSNRTVTVDTFSYMYIYFTPGKYKADVPDGPGGYAGRAFGIDTTWQDSIAGSNYLLVSAPFIRDVITKAQSPSARIVDAGRFITLPTGTIAHRAYEYMPHVFYFEDFSDTTSVFFPGGFDGGGRWETYITQVRGSGGFPIRTAYTDSAAGDHGDSTVIWTSGYTDSLALDFTTSAWSLSQFAIPYATDGRYYGDRLYLAGDKFDPNFIVYSEPFRIGAFPANNAFSVGGNGDQFMRFAQIYDWLVIFQREHTWLLKGGSPSDGGVLELALPDEGCIALNSVVEIENRVIYLSSKGWRIFDGNTAKDFALPIRPAVQAQPRVIFSVTQDKKSESAAAYDPTTGNIWMSMPFFGSSSNNGSFLSNFVDGSLSASNEVYGGNILSTTFRDTLRLFFTHPSAGKIYVYGYTDSLDVKGIDGTSMQSIWSTGWMDMGSARRQKKLGDGLVAVALSSPNSAIDSTRRFYVRMYKDFDTTAFYVDTTNVVGILGGKHYEVQTSIRLEPPADSATVQWWRVEFEGRGLTLMDVQVLSQMYGLGDDVIRDRTVLLRP